MFENLDLLPPDPILGLSQEFAKDPRTDKVNLSVGVYQDDTGNTPVLDIVREAQQGMLEEQTSKAYIAQAGDPGFIHGIANLIFGDLAADLMSANRLAVVQAPGGCGAVRIASEVLNKARPGNTIWAGNPTWANHKPLVSSAGLAFKTYPYYDRVSSTLTFDLMCEGLQGANPGDVLLLHACCHNPTGADLSEAQWDAVVELCKERSLIPFIDVAYQGFGRGVDEDAYGIRKMVAALDEVVIASSCSKNFGLYRERTGAMLFVGRNADETAAARSHALAEARRSYTMAPYHGGGIVGQILADNGLRQAWEDELAGMRDRINGMRHRLTEGLNQSQSDVDFSFIDDQWGMFSFLGISEAQVLQLRDQHGVYILNSSRINVAGISDSNIDYVIEKITEVIS